MKSKGMLWVTLVSLACIRIMFTTFKGTVIARLPFQPASFISGLSHYGLEGNDMQQCSMTFVFILMNLTVGNYCKKVLSLEGPRINMPQPSPWG